MADEKPEETPAEKKQQKPGLAEAVDKAHRLLADEMEGRPYLLVVTSGFERETKGDKTIFAAQWAWRSNVFVNRETGPVLMDFLVSQLSDVAEDPQIGIKQSYQKEKKTQD